MGEKKKYYQKEVSYLLGKGTTNNSFIATKLDINFQYETILSDIFFLNHKLISPIHVF